LNSEQYFRLLNFRIQITNLIMKRNIKLLSLLALSFFIVFSSCDGGDDLTAEEQKIEELSGTWNIASATANDTQITFTGVSITFAVEGAAYSVAGLQAFTDSNLNHDESLASAGTFTLNSNLDVVTLTPGGDFSISSLNKDTGDLTVTYDAPFPKGQDPATSITLNLELAN